MFVKGLGNSYRRNVLMVFLFVGVIVLEMFFWFLLFLFVMVEVEGDFEKVFVRGFRWVFFSFKG